VRRQPVDEGTLLRDAAQRALELGRMVAGTTAPNPPVGCVLVRDGRIVGEGATSPVGGPHAEVRAIDDAGELAVGAIAVVTLEPCAHVGRTPACTGALRMAGVTAVRWLVAEPNPLASGGRAALRAAGIDAASVVSVAPELADLVVRAEHDLRGFLRLVTHARPHVLLKLAQLPDGRTVGADPGERYLTGAAARHRVHELRADVDAVLVGSATVRADDPRLDAREVDAIRQPRPVVLATTGGIPRSAQVLRRDAVILIGDGASREAVRALEDSGAQVHIVPTVLTPSGARIDPVAALELLPTCGILTVLAEPGLTLGRALLAADLVDLVELHVASTSPERPITPALDLAAAGFEPVDVVAAGPDVVVTAMRRSAPGSAAHRRVQAVA
jgi:diaminohydroxyphosphoribosylaminopyrimidine deaminase / 5-amino-6-(5-phosphoribosylamino)uracil reductase